MATGKAHDFTQGSYWGHAIHDMRDGRIGGHSTPRPGNGDIVLRMMKSGRVGKYLLSNVELCASPHDMWFADVEFVGYKDD